MYLLHFHTFAYCVHTIFKGAVYFVHAVNLHLFVLIWELTNKPLSKTIKVRIYIDAIFLFIPSVECPLTQLALMCPLPVAKLLPPPCSKPLSLSPFLWACLSLTLASSHLPSHSAIVWLCKRLTDIECRTPCDKGEGGRILRERKKGRERACSPSPLFSLLTLPSERHGFVCFWKSNIRDGYSVQKWASKPGIWKKLLKSDASDWLGAHPQLLMCMLRSKPPHSLLWYSSSDIPIGLCFASGGQTANW